MDSLENSLQLQRKKRKKFDNLAMNFGLSLCSHCNLITLTMLTLTKINRIFFPQFSTLHPQGGAICLAGRRGLAKAAHTTCILCKPLCNPHSPTVTAFYCRWCLPYLSLTIQACGKAAQSANGRPASCPCLEDT